MNKYKELKKRHQKEFGNFPIFYAFDEIQFKKGMKKLGLAENETNKILSLGIGAYIEANKLKDFQDLIERHKRELDDEIKKDLTGEGFIKDMFKEELANHEYCITFDIEDTLSAIGLTIDEFHDNIQLKNGLRLAKEEYLSDCLKEERTKVEESEMEGDN